MEKVAVIYDKVFLKHNLSSHPENAHRLEAIISKLQHRGIMKDLAKFPIREATKEEISLIHPRKYVDFVEESCVTGKRFIDTGKESYINEHSYKAVCSYIGSLIDLCSAVATGKIESGFALGRPPGHHCEKNEGMGFCLFSNIAIAAEYLLNNNLVKKVAIIDFDVHHGNGTEDCLKENKNVLFISSHQKNIYPYTGFLSNTYNGRIINIPLDQGTNSYEYIHIFDKFIAEKIKNFSPEILLISAGYDAHSHDPLAQLEFDSFGYGILSQKIVQLAEEVCGGKVVFCLEGGYDYQALSEGVAFSLEALLAKNNFLEKEISSTLINQADHMEEFIATLTKEYSC